MSNAIKFTNKGDELEVIAYCNESAVQIIVKDTGIGIHEADIPHVFDRFYQAKHQGTKNREGTGIGLALSKQLIELMEGTMDVASKEDNPDLQKYLRILLDAYDVAIANNGQEALDWLAVKEHHADLIISDVMMPIIDGFTLLGRLKAD